MVKVDLILMAVEAVEVPRRARIEPIRPNNTQPDFNYPDLRA